jgi:hypothetical protein
MATVKVKLKKILFLGSALMVTGNGMILLGSTNTFAAESACEEIYKKRSVTDVSSTVLAEKCYSDIATGVRSASDSGFAGESLLNQHALAISWVGIYSKDTNVKLTYFQKGLKLAQSMSVQKFESGKYWRPVFLSLEAQVLDQGSTLPRNIVRRLSEIRSLLIEATRVTAKTHRMGPARVLGILYLETPVLFGGNIRLAQENLELAFRLDSDFSANTIALARVLITVGEPERAAKILNTLIAKSEDQMESDLIPETKQDQIEAKKLLKETQY